MKSFIIRDRVDTIFLKIDGETYIFAAMNETHIFLLSRYSDGSVYGRGAIPIEEREALEEKMKRIYVNNTKEVAKE